MVDPVVVLRLSTVRRLDHLAQVFFAEGELTKSNVVLIFQSEYGGKACLNS